MIFFSNFLNLLFINFIFINYKLRMPCNESLNILLAKDFSFHNTNVIVLDFLIFFTDIENCITLIITSL